MTVLQTLQIYLDSCECKALGINSLPIMKLTAVHILEESTDMDIGILNDTETIKEGFMTAMVNFKDVVLKRVDKDPLNYAKCVKSFTKQLKTVSTSNHSLFQKALFSFIDDKTMPAKKGCKRKISIQKASKSRRQYKFRGSQGAQKGRPTRDVVKQKNTESAYHCLPKQKKRKKANPHSIAASVESNRPAEKKH